MKNETKLALIALATEDNFAAYVAETDRYIFAEQLLCSAGLDHSDSNGSSTAHGEARITFLEDIFARTEASGGRVAFALSNAIYLATPGV